MIQHALILSFFLLLGPLASAEDRYCEAGAFVFDARYDGGDLDGCKLQSDGSIELTFRPEDNKVDDDFSWFSFRVSAAQPNTLKAQLKFPNTRARFLPKISNDGASWTTLPQDSFTTSQNGKNMDIEVAVDEKGLWISAQELLTQDYYDDWLEQLSAHDDVTVTVLGSSNEERPVYIAKTENKPELIFLLGRQHPGEIPGALAMRGFIDVVLGDSDLARQFRQRFGLIILPLINPDGVANGHSRHNSGEIDLNRDWGPFTQPETRSIAAFLEEIDNVEMTPRLMLDFHATRVTDTMVFYTQNDADVTNPENFAANWLGNVKDRLPAYEFKHDPRPISAQKNTKGYFYTRYGIPSITYEIGDEANREKVLEHTPVFAEEMMRELLRTEEGEHEAPPFRPASH